MSKQSFRVRFWFWRIFKLKVLEPPEDVKFLFEKYSNNGIMSLDDLRSFLMECQGEENATREDAQAIFNSLKHLNIFPRRGLNLEAFFRYLLGDLNGPLSPSREVHHAMNEPLAHYFLYTGHNSYLTSNQLRGDSSVEPIIRDLRRGVRVIELDLWPNSMNNGVGVRHGRTLTKPVDLLKCLNAIKDNAFRTSEYPVVITFEDHLPSNLQAKVAEMVTKTFGDILFCPESDQLQEFPSPESLKKKVMITTKPPKEYLEGQSSEAQQKSRKSSRKEEWNDEKAASKNEETYDKDEIDFEAVLGHRRLIAIRTDKPKGASKNWLNLGEEEVRGVSLSERELVDVARRHGTDEGAHLQEEDEEVLEYRRLIAIRTGKPKGASKNWLNLGEEEVRRVSLSEQELEDVARRHGTDIVRFTQRNLLRIYPKGIDPKGTRITSSNYNPFLGWMHGAQMLAFNMQGYEKNLWFVQGMFRANGGCGYVKKPDFLLSNEDFDPCKDQPVKKILKVEIYSGEGWHLDFHHEKFNPYSPPDFFVEVGIAGVQADKAERRTKVINNRRLPESNEEFEFKLTVPELALLSIEVLEHVISGYHYFGGQTCLPISELRTGIRAVPLYNREGDKYPSTRLLIELNFSDVKENERKEQT